MKLARTLEVVKVQRPRSRGALAMIHDQDRNHVERRPLTDAEKHMIGAETTVFFHAVWNAGSTRWTLLERAQDRNW
jgi:hypothetical protein